MRNWFVNHQIQWLAWRNIMPVLGVILYQGLKSRSRSRRTTGPTFCNNCRSITLIKLEKKTLSIIQMESWPVMLHSNTDDVSEMRGLKHHIVLFLKWWVGGQKGYKTCLSHRDGWEVGWEPMFLCLLLRTASPPPPPTPILQGLFIAVEKCIHSSQRIIFKGLHFFFKFQFIGMRMISGLKVIFLAQTVLPLVFLWKLTFFSPKNKSKAIDEEFLTLQHF